MTTTAKILILSISLVFSAIVVEAIDKDDDHPKAKNLKVLPKDINHDELLKIMKDYSKALGVKCNYCHVRVEVPGNEKPKMDFASDDIIAKNVARKMMKMVEGINEKYMENLGEDYQKVTCVTCHIGKTTPINTTDSLKSNKSVKGS